MSEFSSRPERLYETTVTGFGGKPLPIPIVESERFGPVPAPQTLPALLALVTSGWGPGFLDGWRGQSDIAWRIDPSAVRRLLDHGPRWLSHAPERLTEAVERYEHHLLESARAAGHGYREGRRLGDLEL